MPSSRSARRLTSAKRTCSITCWLSLPPGSCSMLMILNFPELADATSAAPARLWGLAGKGRLEVGADADLTLVDLSREHTIRASELHGKHQISPFDGRQVRGWPVVTVVGGQVVMREGTVLGEPGSGRRVTRR